MVHITDLDNPADSTTMYGDPYSRGPFGYRRRYEGYGGYGMFEDCGPYVFPIIVIIVIIITMGLFIPGFAAPYWMSYEAGNVDYYVGLWRSCTDSPTADAVCQNLVDSNTADWLTATQALMCITLITFVLASLLFIYFIISWSRYFCVKVLIILLYIIAFILCLIGIIIWAAEENLINAYDYDWCFYLVCVACPMMLFVALFLLCIPSREDYPFGILGGGYRDYPPRDNFGFGYGAKPPIYAAPRPVAPPAVGGWGPSYATPVANIYPSSLPRGYGGSPYGGFY